MSKDPIPNARSAANQTHPSDDTVMGNEDVPALRREVERLRAQLTEVAAEAERYRRAACALLNERVPYSPPTEEELHDLLHGPRGKPLGELIAELEREGE
ncbi:MAG: hypothetical protein J0I06_27390 [Planctomycetes bacterium]|nr:hypothetical protein [Planctomycetota bacterium]